jgi:hypothetical protein
MSDRHQQRQHQEASRESERERRIRDRAYFIWEKADPKANTSNVGSVRVSTSRRKTGAAHGVTAGVSRRNAGCLTDS